MAAKPKIDVTQVNSVERLKNFIDTHRKRATSSTDDTVWYVYSTIARTERKTNRMFTTNDVNILTDEELERYVARFIMEADYE